MGGFWGGFWGGFRNGSRGRGRDEAPSFLNGDPSRRFAGRSGGFLHFFAAQHGQLDGFGLLAQARGDTGPLQALIDHCQLVEGAGITQMSCAIFAAGEHGVTPCQRQGLRKQSGPGEAADLLLQFEKGARGYIRLFCCRTAGDGLCGLQRRGKRALRLCLAGKKVWQSKAREE